MNMSFYEGPFGDFVLNTNNILVDSTQQHEGPNIEKLLYTHQYHQQNN